MIQELSIRNGKHHSDIFELPTENKKGLPQQLFSNKNKNHISHSLKLNTTMTFYNNINLK
jgi:hypothetical protein